MSDKQPAKSSSCLGCLGLLVVAAVIGIVGDACSPKDTSSPASTTSLPAAQTSHNADFYTAQKLTAWYNGAQPKITAIQNDAAAIGADASSSDAATVAADCGSLKGHVTDAQTYGPVPDAEAQQHWAAALKFFGQAATHCVNGASTMDGSQMVQASTELTQGSGGISQLSARLREVAAAAA